MAKTFTVWNDGQIEIDGRRGRCALGPAGVIAAGAKREGDGATPAGNWPLRRVLYRPDRLARPAGALETHALRPDDGWCDDPRDPAYNRPVTWPYRAGAEHLWREDEVYDLIVVLGHNDAPVIAGAGSAIFLHIAKDDYAPTRGCVALAPQDLLALLAAAQPGDALKIVSENAPDQP